MARVKDTDIWVDRCTSCSGVFLDKNELNVLATGMSGDIEYCSIDAKKHEDKFAARSCPVCPDQPMRKIDLLIYADTIFDYCPNCEGFYLDKGELAAMNCELEELNRDRLPEEYRGYRGEHLVRLDRFNDAVLGAVGLAGVAAHAVPVFYLRLSVYFEKPLGLDFRLYSEKWAHKLSKFIGAFKNQDVHTGHAVLDPLFVIQGSDERKVRDLLAGEEIQKALKRFSNRPCTTWGGRGTSAHTDAGGPMRAYSMDLRERALLDSDAGMKAADVAAKYRVSGSWVRLLKQRRRDTGEVAPRVQRQGRRGMLEPHLHTLAALIAAHPDRTLAELKDALATPASVPTVWRAVRALGLTVKKNGPPVRTRSA